MHYRSIFLIALALGYFTNPSIAQDKDGFVLVKKEGTISLFERWAVYPGSNPPIKARQVRADFFYNGTVSKGFHLLQNDKRVMEWQNHVSEFKVWLQRDTTTWFEYSYHDIPWPVSDQDHFMEYKVTKHDSHFMVIAFKSKVNKTLAPERKGVTRMELSGTWTFEQLKPDRVRVSYKVYSKPIGIPKVFTDPIIRNNFMTSIAAYVALLEK